MKRLLLMVLLFSLVAPLRAAEPLRVALPPAPYYEKLTTREHYLVPLLLHLGDRLAEVPGVSIADASWTSALLGEFSERKRLTDPTSLFAEFSARLPSDALVRVLADEKELQCIVLTARGSDVKKIPLGQNPTVQSVCESAAAHVANALALSPEAARTLTERRMANPAMFEACLLARRVSVLYPNSIAEARMKLLQKFIGTPDAPNLDFAAGLVDGLRTISNGRASSPAVAPRAFEMARPGVLRLLGTPFEERAYPLLREAPVAFAHDLLDLAKSVPSNALDLALDEGKAPKGDDPGSSSPKNVTLEQRLGALRCLGVIASEAGLEIIRQVVKSEEPRRRQAAAEALRHYEGKTGLDLLTALAEDKDSTVAFAAAHALWKRSQPVTPPPGAVKKRPVPAPKGVVAPSVFVWSPDAVEKVGKQALKLARQFGVDKDAARRGAAREVLCALGTREDVSIMTPWSHSTDAALRSSAVAALVRLGAIETSRWPALLRDSSATVMATALGGLPTSVEPAVAARVIDLANDPAASVAQAARLACAQYRPSEPRARLLHDLAVEHPFIRRRLVDQLAANTSPAALEDLSAACANSDPHTRTHALARLAGRDPFRARAALVKAIADPYHWVRLHAAAQLAELATAAEADAIRKSHGSEIDLATRLYLADALAKAEGRPKPASAPAAYQVAGKTNLSWMCGAGEDCESSPFGAYYLLGAARISEPLQRAHAAGKIIFARATPIGNAGTIMTDPAAMDNFWLSLQSELVPDVLPHLDGVVYGEETMSAATEPLWKNGWPLFCFDAGLDPAKVRGEKTNLSTAEVRAWNDWALTQTVEGFNELYDYTKLRFGKLRPGLQVCTFLPGQGATGPADRRWKFDVGGIYDYKGNHRVAAYTLIRRMKTLWPERPVLWLSLGIGGYEMNPVKHTQKVPEAPMLTRGDRAYADSVAAWLAGADTGWFSTWIFVSPTSRAKSMAQLSGTQIHVEDIVPHGKLLQSGINGSFARLDQMQQRKADSVAPAIDDDNRAEKTVDLAVKDLLEDKKPVANPFTKQVQQDMERMRIGFHFYGKYVYDCARVFASLPRLNPKPAVLAVKPGLSVWSRGADFAAPGHNLLNAYDFLMDINQAADADLARYRLIAMDGLNDAPLNDRTITSLSGWLRERPGLLYVRGALSTDPANEASTAADHDGKLQERWPWTGEVTLAGSGAASSYAVSGANATVLAKDTTGPNLVLWRAPGQRGAVLFDAGIKDAEELRAVINRVAREQQVGLELTGPLLQTMWQESGIVGAASAGGSAANVVHGVDLLEGFSDPAVGPGRSATLVAANLTGRYVASLNGVAVLGEKPLTEVTAVPHGLRVRCEGLLQAGSQNGRVTIKVEGGDSLPQIIVPARMNEWLLFGKEEGICIWSPPDRSAHTLTFVRSTRPIVVSAAPAE